MPYAVSRKILGLFIIGVVVGAGSAVVFLYESTSGCILVCGHDQFAGERIGFDSVYVNSSTLVTLTIRNTGTLQVILISYSVNDSTNHQYANTGWSGPTLSPDAVRNVGLTIDGNAFTFQSGGIYKIILVSSTSKNWQFTFTV